MKKTVKKMIAAASAGAVLCGSLALSSLLSGSTLTAVASESIADQTEVGTLGIAGGGFVSGIVTGETTMYARTDVGGAYKYNYDTGNWDQLLDFIDEEDRGLLSIDAMCLDPNDENTIYMLAGCAYFSGARTVIFRSRDGGETFDEIDVTDLIQVHGNGYGRQCGEAIAVDPDNPDIIYCGGDVTAGDSALIWSQDGGDTWEPVKGYDELGYFQYTVHWPFWEEHFVRAATTSVDSVDAYAQQNGVATIVIKNGKVYVGTSVKGTTNVVVADVGKNQFTALSDSLPTEYYPSRFTLDNNGNLYITYLSSILLGKETGGIYKYNISTGEVKDVSPSSEGYGGISADPENPDKLIASTCANSPMSQLWYENAWEDGNVAWGERFFRSVDGGESWEEITPGNAKAWGQPLMADYLQDGGRKWIRNKSIHWAGSAVLDPRNSDRFFVTSGNGIFVCDKTWSELPQYTFHSDGIEEVVALDMVSSKGKNPFSAIGDYDGFEHTSKTESVQHQPNMGSTAAIAACPSNPDVMVRASQDNNKTYYTLDGGDSWVEMNGTSGGGKAAITELEDGTYRIFRTGNGSASYTDDFGATWNNCSGVKGTKELKLTVDEENPQYVYGYTAQYNDYWFYDTSKSEPTFEDAHYVFMVSDDYGATFTTQDTCKYDQCDVANRIGYLGEGEMVLGAGWYGAYYVTDYGKNIEKLDSVFYCKTIGYGAPEKEGGVNTLYMYGQPEETDPQGVYRSTDAGKTWVLINSDHLYGGTGNGNFLVGDMNEFGTVYMSTVGCGIVYMQSAGGTDPKPTTTTATTTTTTDETTTTTSGTGTTTSDTATTTGGIVTTTSGNTDDLIGDTNLDGKVDLLDAICLNKHLAQQITLDGQAYRNANCNQADGTPTVDEADGTALVSYVVMLITKLPVME